MDEDGESWGGSWITRGTGREVLGLWCASPEQGKGLGLPQHQHSSPGLGTAAASPTQVQGKYPGTVGLELPVKSNTFHTEKFVIIYTHNFIISLF